MNNNVLKRFYSDMMVAFNFIIEQDEVLFNDMEECVLTAMKKVKQEYGIEKDLDLFNAKAIIQDAVTEQFDNILQDYFNNDQRGNEVYDTILQYYTYDNIIETLMDDIIQNRIKI